MALVAWGFNIGATQPVTGLMVPSPLEGTVGVAFTAHVEKSGGDGTFSYSATGLPPGLSISSTTGEITGTPTTPGSYTPIFTITDTGTY